LSKVADENADNDAVEDELTTPRLRLGPFTMGDLQFLHDLWTEPQVRRYLWDDRVITLDDACAVVDASITSFAARGFGFWVVRWLASDESIGFAGLREFGDAGEIELLYGLLPQRWGQGIATEAARAVLEYGFRRCGLDRIYAGADPPNDASIRVIELLGMQFDSRRTIDGIEALYYVLENPRRSS
jgi:ribosomal-protein-alanine N-acetyltransferase